MLDGLYFPEPIKNKSDWFNGFIRIEKHPKEKYGWYRYVYLPDYYTDNCKCGQVSVPTRFGCAIPHIDSCLFVDQFFVNYYERLEKRMFRSGSKYEIGEKSIGAVTLLNTATGEVETHPSLYINSDYIIRQLNDYDKPQIKDVLYKATKEIGQYFPMMMFTKYLHHGMMAAPISKNGEMHGIQAFSFIKGEVSPEPLTYITSEARGQGIFNIYHDMVVELGEDVGAEFIFAQCIVENDKMREVYEAYGYIREEKTKFVGKSDIQEVYIFKYPLKTQQQALF